MPYSDFLGYSFLDPIIDLTKVTVVGAFGLSETVITIDPTDYDNFLLELKTPTNFGDYTLLWFDDTNFTSPLSDPSREFVRVTAHNDTNRTITVTRAQHETPASPHNTGGATYEMILGLHSRHFSDIGNSIRLSPIRNGAAGDGATDDTVAFQTSITQLEAAGGGTLVIPDGNFNIAGTITVIGNGIHIIGNGNSSILSKTGTGNLFDVGDTGGGRRIFSLERLLITGAAATNRALNVLNFREISVRHVDFDWEGQAAIGGSSFISGRVESCDFRGIRTFAIDATDGNNIEITSCFFTPFANGIGRGINLIGMDGGAVSNCDFNNLDNGVRLNDTNAVTINGSRFTNNNIAILDVTTICNGIFISSNFFSVTPGIHVTAIDLTTVDTVRVVGNRFSGTYTINAPIRAAVTAINCVFGPNIHLDTDQVTFPGGRPDTAVDVDDGQRQLPFLPIATPAQPTLLPQLFSSTATNSLAVIDSLSGGAPSSIRTTRTDVPAAGASDPNSVIFGYPGDWHYEESTVSPPNNNRIWFKQTGEGTNTGWVVTAII